MGSALRRSEGGELLFDVNALAEGHDAYIFAGYAVSPDNKLAAYFANTTGSYAEFDLHIRDSSVAKTLPLRSREFRHWLGRRTARRSTIP